MHYVLVPEEIQAATSLLPESQEYTYLEKKRSFSEQSMYYAKKLAKLRCDSRLLEFEEGFFICQRGFKEEVEQEYGCSLLPIHPDDVS